jgi:hypothetical protein
LESWKLFSGEKMERVTWIDHKGKKILYINYSKLKASLPDEKQLILDTIKQARDFTVRSTEKIRYLSDVTNTSANTEVMSALKEFATFTAGNNKVEKECVVGLTGIQKILVSGVNAFAKSKLVMFDDIEKAKDWLVEQ